MWVTMGTKSNPGYEAGNSFGFGSFGSMKLWGTHKHLNVRYFLERDINNYDGEVSN